MSDKAPRSKRTKRKREAAPPGDPTPNPSPQRGGEPEGPLRLPLPAAGRGPGGGVSGRPGWTVPHPEELPRPTFWPAALAFAVTFLLWGIVTSPIITAVGGLLLVVSLSGWIGDIRNERAH